MAGSKSNYLSKVILNHVLGNTPYTAAATVYVGLWTTAGSLTDPSGGTAANEVSASGTAYGRQSLTNDTTNWPNATGSTTGLKQNGVAITWSTATASWGIINQFALLDAASSGNILYWGDLTTPKSISTGDTASFSAGALTITEN